ncbi:alanine/glycine:cation symporter family protein [Thermovenabulum gondwanense]|uniref:Amino-acid carrier protein AlsT n=1 Tax=Thermovenabulum gondwanense TaxID=520767 RepID=A0A162MCV7_9FIRM|nr:sodium:alanine symporter family protein [Thermovenabulum gondwanense]KYO65278.1 Amino-acid carrier protein AlsT [Thermovenabulum gondwanense]
MEAFAALVGKLGNIVWGPPMLVLLVGTHLLLTFRLRFIQRYTFKAIKLSLAKSAEGEGDVSHFGALATALAATVGTGNIVGVATAVGLGGPGAIFWLWITGVFGIATKYAETLLSVKYRVKNELGQMAGGPMYVLERGLKMKWLGVLFALFTAIAGFGIGVSVQANSIADMVKNTFNIPTWITGLVIAVLTAIVILGGIKSIARVCEALVPFMAIVYVLGCLIIILMNISALPGAIATILKSAFTGQAMIGGFAGAGVMQAIRYGVARGVFSNESGLGSAPIAAAAAQTPNPARQALVQMTGTFWDTVVICLLTGLVLVTTGAWQTGLKGAALTKTAFEHIPVVGPITLTLGLLTFVYSTILGWSYYCEKAVEYLFGTKAVMPYRVLWVIAAFVGSVMSLGLVWDIADVLNGMMAIPNLISLIALSGVLVAETKKYVWEDRLEEKAPEENF